MVRRGKHALPRDWNARRRTVRQLAGGRCACCPREARVGFCDHVIGRAEGGSDGIDNLQWLCKGCHEAKTREEIKRGHERRAARGRFEDPGGLPSPHPRHGGSGGPWR